VLGSQHIKTWDVLRWFKLDCTGLGDLLDVCVCVCVPAASVHLIFRAMSPTNGASSVSAANLF